MSGVDSYSTTPTTNATATGGAINFAEGMPPSAVNNSARQEMTDIRNAFNDLAWFVYGTGNQGAGNIAVPAVYSSGTVFTIAGADVTAAYHLGRRVRAVGSSTGTIYGRISVTSYAPTTTTVTVVWDSGSLSNETLVISLSQIPVTGVPVPSGAISGTKTNDSAASGTVGEYLESVVLAGSGISMTTGVVADITTLALTAGDWDVWGTIATIAGGGTTASLVAGATTTVSATLPTAPANGYMQIQAAFPASANQVIPLGVQRVSITATTTYRLVGRVDFAVSTMVAYGFIAARRRR